MLGDGPLVIEFVVAGTPVSGQGRRPRQRELQRAWREKITKQALVCHPVRLAEGMPVEVAIDYYFDEHTGDVDNMIKPIQDGLRGVMYEDDRDVVNSSCGKRDIRLRFRIEGASPLLVEALAAGKDFVHVRVRLVEDLTEIRR